MKTSAPRTNGAPLKQGSRGLHFSIPPFLNSLDLRVLHHLFAFLQLHVRLLPVRTVAGVAAAPAHLAGEVRRPHRFHFHLENALHGVLDIGLRRVEPDSEAECALGILVHLALLGYQRPLDHIEMLHRKASESFCAVVSYRITRSCSR